MTATTPIAGALNLIGKDTLFGRNWGCTRDVPFLHFEVCYYQAIDFAITHGLKTVEAGAQGEHKLARGYEPVITRSIHWIAHPGLRRAVADYLEDERAAVDQSQGRARPLHAVPARRHGPTSRIDSGGRAMPANGQKLSGEHAMTAFDPDNIFAKIIRGEIPSHKVYEDEVVFAMMDIMPQADGHVLVLPKQGSRNLLDADPDVLAETMKRVQILARAVMKAMNADGLRSSRPMRKRRRRRCSTCISTSSPPMPACR